ncbi:unnamed protein product (macronuclear) [Paramecium tetraurelia]|uniref:ER lumen protein-retaining receptor n=1 Tax=Paramecium tetraurelia TaxID=5888 RepID=A0EB77_PARTE|nr:uncharacterized protein GSPATT00025278001 [Paramecium tetraurelia]CAK92544.1 unnamed protein product [Paramecium tetraurelia]|eukprot:XP_001459941.1 hypothetical protein (macronuclear) [Paramecium tetraurelia strain d4-2]
MFNPFRYIADFLHLVSFLIPHFKNTAKPEIAQDYHSEPKKSILQCSVSDTLIYSLYNTSMKLLYISSTVFIIYLMKFKKPYCLSYDSASDDFPHYKFIYTGAAVLALLVHTDLAPFELGWSYSIWLEALAIIPQLHMLQKIKDVENITSNYVGALGVYRFFYIVSWIYKYSLTGDVCWTSLLGGIVQTILYADFLYYYIISLKSGKGMSLGV